MPGDRGRRVAPVAIDGPAASGKTALGQRLAAALGYGLLDTGLMYRAFTLAAIRAGIGADDAPACGRLARRLRLDVDTEGGRVRLDGEDVTERMRDREVERLVSRYSAIPAVREALVARQRALAAERDLIVVGRDIGTVVLPDAELKVYLDASPRVRAHRRAEQLRAMGQVADEVALEEEIRRRDAIDSSREASPLTAAPDAVKINTDDLTVEEVVRRLVDAARG